MEAAADAVWARNKAPRGPKQRLAFQPREPTTGNAESAYTLTRR